MAALQHPLDRLQKLIKDARDEGARASPPDQGWQAGLAHALALIEQVRRESEGDVDHVGFTAD